VSDTYELLLTMDIRPDLPEDEFAELKWHVGQGSRPERLPLGTDDYLATYPLGDPNDPDCEWEIAEPEPAFAQRGAASIAGGALVADLVRREQPDGWSLTVRQELHPDVFYPLRTLLDWLGRNTANGRNAFIGYLRHHESLDIEPLVLLDGQIRVPEDLEAHTPDWEST
jgi:hypothetical protein